MGFIGIPEYTSTETGVPFFFEANALSLDTSYRDMRAAIAACDRKAYDRAHDFVYIGGSGEGTDPNVGAKINRDSARMKEALRNAPPFPEPCYPPSRQGGDRFHPYSFALLGGGAIPLNSYGSVTGVDTFFGSGNYLISNQSSGASNTTPIAGAHIHASVFSLLVGDFTPFVETGVQSAFGAQSLMQPFQRVSTTPQGFGTNTINENFQIPILVGISTPIFPTVSFNVYGGITLDSWTQTLQGREAGAPGGPGFFAQSQRFTVDPTVGFGVLVPAGGGFIFGLNTEVQFRPGSVVTAPSNNFPSETYYGTVNPTANLLIMGRIGIQFGGK